MTPYVPGSCWVTKNYGTPNDLFGVLEIVSHEPGERYAIVKSEKLHLPFRYQVCRLYPLPDTTA